MHMWSYWNNDEQSKGPLNKYEHKKFKILNYRISEWTQLQWKTPNTEFIQDKTVLDVNDAQDNPLRVHRTVYFNKTAHGSETGYEMRHILVVDYLRECTSLVSRLITGSVTHQRLRIHRRSADFHEMWTILCQVLRTNLKKTL